MPANKTDQEKWPFFLQMYSFFYTVLLGMMFPTFCFSQDFQQIDLNRLLQTHPLIKQFDPATGRFRGTSSEIIHPARLASTCIVLEAAIKAAEERKSGLAQAVLLSNHDADTMGNFWQEVSLIDNQIAGYQKELTATKALLSDGGDPGLGQLTLLLRQLLAEILPPQPAIRLNLFPRLAAPIPGLPESDHLRVFMNNGQLSLLQSYLSYSTQIGRLFPACAEPILYQSKETHP